MAGPRAKGTISEFAQAHLGLEAARHLAEILAQPREVLGPEDQRADNSYDLHTTSRFTRVE